MKQPSYTVEEFTSALSAGAYAWPGGYPLYFLTHDGEALSFEAARQHETLIADAIREGSNDGWRVIGCVINWEDNTLHCAHTGKRIKSAYAD